VFAVTTEIREATDDRWWLQRPSDTQP